MRPPPEGFDIVSMTAGNGPDGPTIAMHWHTPAGDRYLSMYFVTGMLVDPAFWEYAYDVLRRECGK